MLIVLQKTTIFMRVSTGGDATLYGWPRSMRVAGDRAAPHSTVSDGLLNRAGGEFASVSGGRENEASGIASSVSGGRNQGAANQWDWRSMARFLGIAGDIAREKVLTLGRRCLSWLREK